MENLEKQLQEGLEAVNAQVNESADKSNTAVKEVAEKLEATQKETSKQLNQLGEDFEALAEKVRGTESNVDASKMVEDFLTENIDAIKTSFRNGMGRMEVKAVGTVTTANGTLPTALPVNYVAETQGVPNVALRRPTLLDYVNTYSTNQKTLAYVEAVPGEGDFAVVAEGALKPQLDIDWVTRYAVPQKWAGFIKVTEEAIEDIPRLRDLILNYLRDKHDLVKEKAVYAYIDTNSTAYVTGGPLAASVVDPTIMDVVYALQSQVINSPNYTDEPDFYGDLVLMNIVDFYKYFGMAKDALGRPLFADGYQGGRTFRYNGYMFLATTLVPAGEIKVLDSSKVDVTTYSGYRSEIGWTDKDFIMNMFVLLGESRGHIVIKNHDRRAFVKGSILAIINDLKAPVVEPAG